MTFLMKSKRCWDEGNSGCNKISMQTKIKGISASLASALFLGLAPVFGKQAINQGMPPLEVVALRTFLATLLIFGVIFLFKRQYLYIYPAGLMGCLLAGGINGLGSLLYYSALGRINASVGQLLYSLYPLFVMLWMMVLDNQHPSRLTLIRLLMILPALFLLTQAPNQSMDLLGVLMMLGASILYALHLPINQRVLYDMPAPTVTFYTLFAMSIVVIPAFLFSGTVIFTVSQEAMRAVLGLSLVTFFSRLTLFLGVKHLGGMQAALLGLGELLVTLIFSYLWLDESLSLTQWIGVGLLVASLSLVASEKTTSQRVKTRCLNWLRPPEYPSDFPLP
jgi:drug/metabolite transporter (DMT)-like permease